MKKSSKKVKSDRINALRKQYDAFVEEDKKRKQRNDFILNKLDKMRYSSTTLSRSVMPTLHVSPQSGLYKTLDKPSTYDSYLPSPTKQLTIKHLDDSILQEISKTYFLIPKRSSMFSNKYRETIKPAIDNDSDWKSKYDILNELKQNDKAEREKENPVKDEEPFVKVLNNEQILNNNLTDTSDTKQNPYFQYANITPVKELNQSITDKLNKMYNDDIKSTEIITCPEKQFNENNTHNVSSTVINDSECKITAKNVAQENTELKKFINPVENTEELINSNRNTLISENLECSNNILPEPELPQQKESLENPGQNNTQKTYISAVESSDLTKITAKNNNVITTEDLAENEVIQYPIEIINVPEFTPDENVILKDGVNINPDFDREDSTLTHEPQHEVVREGSATDSIYPSGIEAFDAEQREMFYSEEPNENYSYDQTNPESTYQEYPQNENYQQNEEYTYYGKVPQDQNYSAEVNEFEETSQPYDQTYEEQYAAYDPVSYVQEDIYKQEPQQYEEIQGIDPSTETEMEQLQYEQQNYEPQQVEKQLDKEQGYTENEEMQITQFAENTPNQEIKSDHTLENSKLQENIIHENTLNN